MIHLAKPGDELGPVDPTNELLKEMNIDGTTGTEKRPRQADEAESSLPPRIGGARTIKEL